MHVASDAPKRPALRYYGGKWQLAQWIIDHFPEHQNYVESCGGAASVLLQKPRSPLETYNDLDGNVVNFFRVLRDQPDELIRKIRLTPYSRAEYELARDMLSDGDSMERARRFFTASWQSISGGPDPLQCTSGWSVQKLCDARYTLPAPLVRKVVSQLDQVVSRFDDVQIENRDARDCIKRFDNEGALHYFDPPYMPGERGHSKQYAIDQDAEFHSQAAALLRQCDGYVVVSGYACDLYRDLYEAHGWTRFDKETQTNSGGKRIESLWLSPRTIEALQMPQQLELMQVP